MPIPFQPAGVYSAQWIPTDAHGRIDRAALAEHVQFERSLGITGMLALGSTGEFPHFTAAERAEVLTVLAELGTPLPLIANVSDIRPRVAIELGRHARATGYAAVALMPPMFYPVSQADMLAYFLAVAEAVDLPVMLYNFPELTGKRIAPETVAAFADRASMAAIKQSGAEFEYHRQLIALGREKGFVVMSGADTRLPEVFGLGAAGCIGGLVNIVPEVMVGIYRVCSHAAAGDVGRRQILMSDLGRIIDQLTFPLNVAAGLEARGLRPGEPKAVVSAESRRLYAKVVAELQTLFAREGIPSAAALSAPVRG